MKIAVEGCAHGELEVIYNTIETLEEQNDMKVDLLICCGDFQATRNLEDLKCMAVPPKYRDMCSFYKYYSGEKKAPILTIFIGGNHEASNYLQELPYGGWVAPNIYYLGYAGVVDVAGVRIAGLSGIFKGFDYYKGRYEKPPYNGETQRSCYHIRGLDVFRLKQLSQSVNICLSHDWPAGVYNHGNLQQLLKNKPFFKDDIQNDALGSKPAAELLYQLKPDYWFAAHLHVKFAALIKHEESENQRTKFLSLDKCLPRRKFLQIIDFPHDEKRNIELCYDVEWLTILQLTNHLISIKKVNSYLPGPNSNERWKFTPTEEEKDLVKQKFKDDLKIPQNFVQNVPAYDPNAHSQSECPLQARTNPQTTQFCDRLGIDDPMSLLMAEEGINSSDSSLNSSVFDNSSFIFTTDSEADSSSSMNPPSTRTPLKLPTPVSSTPYIKSALDDDFPSSNTNAPTRTPLKLPKPLSNFEENSISSPNKSLSCDKSISDDVTFSDSDLTPVKVSEPLSENEANSFSSPAGELGKRLSMSDIKAPSPSTLPMPDFDKCVSDRDDLPTAPGPKKFRRRNFSAYASNEEDLS